MRSIKTNNWLSDLELEEIKRKIARGEENVNEDIDLVEEVEERVDEFEEREDVGEVEVIIDDNLELDNELVLSDEQSILLTKLVNIYEEDKASPNILFKYVDNKKLTNSIIENK